MGNSLRSDHQDFSKVLTFQWIYIERATHAKKKKKNDNILARIWRNWNPCSLLDGNKIA